MITLGLIVAVFVAISNGEWGPAAVGAFLLLFIFGLFASAGEDSRAYVNRVHYWSQSPEERERERRRAKARVDREEREARERAYEKARKQRERDRAKALKQQEKEAEEKRRLQSGNGGAGAVEVSTSKQASKPKCERCEYDVREVSRSSYNGNIFILYHCPYCSEKKLKKYDSMLSWLIPEDEKKIARGSVPAQPVFRPEVRQARCAPVLRPEMIRNVQRMMYDQAGIFSPVTNVNTYRSPMDDIMGTNNRHRREETLTCMNCRTWIRTDSIEVMDDGKKVREYCCPACGARIHYSVA